jgi:hypothetical protein
MSTDDRAAFVEGVRPKPERAELAGPGPIQLHRRLEVPDVERRPRLALGRVESCRSLSPEDRSRPTLPPDHCVPAPPARRVSFVTLLQSA